MRFLSASLRRLLARRASFKLAHNGDAASSFDTKKGVLGKKVAGLGGTRVSGRLNGVTFIDLRTCMLYVNVSYSKYVSQSVLCSNT